MTQASIQLLVLMTAITPIMQEWYYKAHTLLLNEPLTAKVGLGDRMARCGPDDVEVRWSCGEVRRR